MEVEDDCHIPVVEATCRYKAPARYDDEIVVETKAAVLRGYILKFNYRIVRADDGKLLAEGETAHVVTDRKMQRKLLPEKYIAALGQAGKSENGC